MRVASIALPFLLIASPAVAQSTGKQAPLKAPPELSDPRLAERLGKMSQALGKAFLNLPVGELEAIADGREPTAADRRRTVRDSARAHDPDFDRDFQQQMAGAGPMIEQSMKAMAAAMPAMMEGLEQARDALERATANMPSPTYPKR